MLGGATDSTHGAASRSPGPASAGARTSAEAPPTVSVVAGSAWDGGGSARVAARATAAFGVGAAATAGAADAPTAIAVRAPGFGAAPDT